MFAKFISSQLGSDSRAAETPPGGQNIEKGTNRKEHRQLLRRARHQATKSTCDALHRRASSTAEDKDSSCDRDGRTPIHSPSPAHPVPSDPARWYQVWSPPPISWLLLEGLGLRPLFLASVWGCICLFSFSYSPSPLTPTSHSQSHSRITSPTYSSKATSWLHHARPMLALELLQLQQPLSFD